MAGALHRILAAAMAAFLLAALAGPVAAVDDESRRVEASADRPRAGARDVPPSLRRWIRRLPPERRNRAIEHLRGMPPERREVFFRRWRSMSVPERHRLQGRLEERADRVDRRARSELRDSFDRSADQLDRNRQAWREMGPRERQRMRRRLERFRELSAFEQEKAIDRHFADRSTEERARILERMRSAARRLPDAPR